MHAKMKSKHARKLLRPRDGWDPVPYHAMPAKPAADARLVRDPVLGQSVK